MPSIRESLQKAVGESEPSPTAFLALLGPEALKSSVASAYHAKSIGFLPIGNFAEKGARLVAALAQE